MKANTISVLAVIALICPVSPSMARPPLSKAEAVIAKSKRATGGVAWDKPQGCYEQGTHANGAIAYTTRFSLLDYGMRIDSERGGRKRAMGFDGKAQWQAGDDGKVDVRTDPASIAEAVVTAYLSNNGFYFPDRFPAALNYVRLASEAGRRFDVLEITPRGGRTFETWFDRRTHLIKRVVDRSGTPPTIIEADDYLAVGGLTVAFSLNVIGPDGHVVDHGAVTSFRCGPIDNAIFESPAAR